MAGFSSATRGFPSRLRSAGARRARRPRRTSTRSDPTALLAMKICMMTNTYLPHVGGVARSVSTFAEEYRRQGHDVLVVAPTFEGKPLPKRIEAIVERVAAIQNFNG